ncbi:helix-turn-helix transcriptional regulator [Cytobacillus sp. IB215665]|uniref:helix-turn-helix transcriptional regulator n=1 Tax=Cytobacillus sp. IB215665 TaxID=3097357 RepID=UPI002A16EEDC|nr:helix-turn-helix transcriptional regulator [Cytobacillus sp. IB215665]MDX8367884.1 helix-turn-helix transcriptional regulator [Cytobacillus sp. IB215665]
MRNEIAIFRKKKDLTQQQLAEIVGVSVGHICKIENGQKNASLYLLLDIADALDTTVGELIPGIF